MMRFALSASNRVAARASTEAMAPRVRRLGGAPPGGGGLCTARREASCSAALTSPTWMRPGAVMTAPLWLRLAFGGSTALRARASSGSEGGFALRPGALSDGQDEGEMTRAATLSRGLRLVWIVMPFIVRTSCSQESPFWIAEERGALQVGCAGVERSWRGCAPLGRGRGARGL